MNLTVTTLHSLECLSENIYLRNYQLQEWNPVFHHTSWVHVTATLEIRLKSDKITNPYNTCCLARRLSPPSFKPHKYLGNLCIKYSCSSFHLAARCTMSPYDSIQGIIVMEITLSQLDETPYKHGPQCSLAVGPLQASCKNIS